MRRTAKGVRSKFNIDSPDVGQHGSSPRIRRKQPHNAASSSSQTAASVSHSNTEQRLPPVMAMPPEARSVWNLKILRRHDPLISRIFDQAPYGVLYTFNHAHAHEPDGGKGRKYEGTWEKTGIEGTVFLVERSASPQYGFFLLNRGGTSSVFQMLHQDDTVELGADPKFLTFRPGLWDRATTPYTEPFTRCDKPSLICLWLSDETAGPRFAYFISRTKSLLSRDARPADTSSSSPPPLSQAQPVDHTPKQPTVAPQDVERSQILDASGNENLTSEAPERPLDKLFASFAQPLNTTASTAPSQTRSATGGVNPATSIEEAQNPTAHTDSASTSISPFAQGNPLSLLDQIFASAASETTSVQLAGGPSALETGFERSNDPREGKASPTTPSPTALHSSGTALSSSDSDHAFMEDEVALTTKQQRPYWATGTDNGSGDFTLSALDKGRNKTGDGEYQELEAPSPSLIPNPLHTPMSSSVAGPMVTRNAATSCHALPGRAGIRASPGYASQLPSLDHRDSMHHSNGPSAMRHAIESTDPESALDVNRATAALLDSLQSRRSGGADGARSIPISKRDFVGELLTLIYEPGFIDDLYARYETLTRWDQMT